MKARLTVSDSHGLGMVDTPRAQQVNSARSNDILMGTHSGFSTIHTASSLMNTRGSSYSCLAPGHHFSNHNTTNTTTNNDNNYNYNVSSFESLGTSQESAPSSHFTSSLPSTSPNPLVENNSDNTALLDLQVSAKDFTANESSSIQAVPAAMMHNEQRHLNPKLQDSGIYVCSTKQGSERSIVTEDAPDSQRSEKNPMMLTTSDNMSSTLPSVFNEESTVPISAMTKGNSGAPDIIDISEPVGTLEAGFFKMAAVKTQTLLPTIDNSESSQNSHGFDPMSQRSVLTAPFSDSHSTIKTIVNTQGWDVCSGHLRNGIGDDRSRRDLGAAHRRMVVEGLNSNSGGNSSTKSEKTPSTLELLVEEEETEEAVRQREERTKRREEGYESDTEEEEDDDYEESGKRYGSYRR